MDDGADAVVQDDDRDKKSGPSGRTRFRLWIAGESQPVCLRFSDGRGNADGLLYKSMVSLTRSTGQLIVVWKRCRSLVMVNGVDVVDDVEGKWVAVAEENKVFKGGMSTRSDTQRVGGLWRAPNTPLVGGVCKRAAAIASTTIISAKRTDWCPHSRLYPYAWYRSWPYAVAVASLLR